MDRREPIERRGLRFDRIRQAAEAEERDFYEHRAPREWLDALAPLGTDPEKPFLEIAPYLIVCFVQLWGEAPDGTKVKHYLDMVCAWFW